MSARKIVLDSGDFPTSLPMAGLCCVEDTNDIRRPKHHGNQDAT
ncbi:hypothetical protein BDD21_0061 [Thiocapsa rosea]|uniref:Uncharacterized protein n=1 Tax=Thiocapsa rosea TaxID=69360 RepID=A0A495UZZ3_9GAMM|nr:hypothetical protein BDD21_0061 [Thiocapsa rosea]